MTYYWLLANGVDVNVKTDKGVTALHAASLYGHLDIIEFLLANGADLNATPLLQKFNRVNLLSRQVFLDSLEFYGFQSDGNQPKIIGGYVAIFRNTIPPSALEAGIQGVVIS